MSQILVTGEAKIRDIQGPVVSNSGVITALDGDASQYVRGDGTLADFPTSTGGGSSVSYYLNSSVSQGTIGGVAYRQLGKTPISGAGTDIAISTTGYVASYITDANDPALLEVPAGNFNCEFYFSVNNNTGNPFVYAEVYKYDGAAFTLLGTSVGVPEYITEGTVINPYYFAVPVATSVLTVTDRISIRIYVNVDGRVVTLHTENNHLCQVVTTFSKGLISLNNLTRQNQFFGTGTSGTDFNIASATATHTFNLPVASATNTGKLSSTDWSTFNGKVPYTGATASVDLGVYALTAGDISASNLNAIGLGTQCGYLFLKQGTAFLGGGLGYSSINASATKFLLTANVSGANNKEAIFELGSLTNNTQRTFTLPDLSGTLALLEGSQTFSGDKTFSGYALMDIGVTLAKTSGTPLYGSTNGYANLQLVNAGSVNSLFLIDGDTGKYSKLSFNNAADYTYTFPNITGTLALLEGSQTFSGAKSFSGGATFTSLLNINRQINIFKTPSLVAFTGGYITNYGTSNGIIYADGDTGNLTTFIYNFGGNYNYTFPAATGTIALTSNLSSYVPYSGATGNVDLGVRALFAQNIVVGQTSTQGYIHFKTGGSTALSADTSQAPYGTNGMIYSFDQTGSNYKQFVIDSSLLTNNTIRTYSMPNATGTIALTSDLGSYVTLATTQTISAIKKYTDYQQFDNGIKFKSDAVGSSIVSGYVSMWFGIGDGKNVLGLASSATSPVYYTYAFPNAAGTLALTSDLAAYLPLAGGTLTGALSGTSATFSGGVTTNAYSYLYGLRISGNDTTNTIYSSSANMGITADSGYNIFIGQVGSTTTGIRVNTTNGALTATSATFSSSVTATNLFTSTLGINVSNYGYLTQTLSGQMTILGHNVKASTSVANQVDVVNGGWISSMIKQYYNEGITFHSSPTTYSAGAIYPMDTTERMRITNTGNVGIGTSNPSPLTGGALITQINSSNANVELKLTNSSASNGFLIAQYGVNNYISNRENGFMAFDTNATERMRITSGGNVLISQTTDNNDGKLEISTTGGNAIKVRQTSAGGYGLEILAANNGGTYYFQNFTAGTTGTGGSITSNGVLVAFNTTSDYRLKQDLKDYSGLNLVSAIKTYDYEWKLDKSRMYGVLAHELQEVIPYAVTGEKDAEEMQQVDYSKIVPILIKSIQELEARIKELENK